MTASFSLPSGCIIRPAQATDRTTIRNLLTQFRQEILPPVSQAEWTMRIVAVGLLGGVGIHLGLTLGLQSLWNLLWGPGVVVGLGILTAAFVNWQGEWENFWVIEYHNQLVACAKLRQHQRYSLLHDVYVLPEWRSQGLGSFLVAHLGEQANKPLYLTCLPKLTQFYMRLGFRPVSTKTLSPLIQYDLGIPGRMEVIPLVLR
ncbi:acetyltransferase, N-acetylglutamate synthase [Leptolyngbyaceae cyanobacterium JSC-12]|nr:acetyltransferase, N-acetylglutamate synthase [Leptolyngbyaceae cyanobacterium JSC-12]